jgi:hypothetical protein
MTTRTRVRVFVTAALGLSLVMGGAASANARPASESGGQLSARPMAQKYYWEWTDQFDTLSRTFKESQFGDAAALPHLIASVEPASPKRTVYLRFLQDGKWLLEAKKKTNSSGEATLDFNPWCNSAETNWCDGTWTYKLSIGDVVKKFKIKYSSK